MDSITTGKALFSRMSDAPVFKANYKEIRFPETPNEPLYAEDKYKTRFESISFFRTFPRESFPIQKALQDYHGKPIAYALALAQLNTEVFRATRKRIGGHVTGAMYNLATARRLRDMVSLEDYDTGSAGLKSSHILRYLKSRFSLVLDLYFLGILHERIDSSRFENAAEPDYQHMSGWNSQITNFVTNVNFFCQHTGSEVDELATPHKTIQNLRKFASDRRQELAPLLEVNAKLNKELTSYKRSTQHSRPGTQSKNSSSNYPTQHNTMSPVLGPNGKNYGTKSGKTQATTLTIHFTPSGRRRKASTLETISETRDRNSLLT